jgi:hypothetical protein
VGIHEGNHLVTEVGVVAPGSWGIDELGPSVSRPGVDPDHDAGRRASSGEQPVRRLGEGVPVGGAVAPHGQRAGVALDHVHGGQALRLVRVVAGRHVDPERTVGRITERVALEDLRLNDVLEHLAGEPALPVERHR